MFPYGLEGERLSDFFDAAPVFNGIFSDAVLVGAGVLGGTEDRIDKKADNQK